jgi:hypothetical protein
VITAARLSHGDGGVLHLDDGAGRRLYLTMARVAGVVSFWVYDPAAGSVRGGLLAEPARAADPDALGLAVAIRWLAQRYRDAYSAALPWREADHAVAWATAVLDAQQRPVPGRAQRADHASPGAIAALVRADAPA